MELQKGKTVRIHNTKSPLDGRYAKVAGLYKDGDPDGNVGLTILGTPVINGTVRFHEEEIELVDDIPTELKPAPTASEHFAEVFKEDMGP